MNLKTFIAASSVSLLTLSAQTVLGQSHDIIYMKQENIKVAGITTDSQVDTLGLTRKQTTFVYYDGFGRPVQTVGMQATPAGKDFIQPATYDSLGRQAVSYLPYTDGSTYGYYQATALSTGQPAFYSDTSDHVIARDSSPYATQVFEHSPLQRLLSSGMVGSGFQPGGAGTQHYKTVSYRSNSYAQDGHILLWNPDGTYTTSTYYADTSLAVTDGKDEDNVETLIFTDLANHVILKRQVHSGGNLDTYYIYNLAGMLSYVVPPKATALLAANSYHLTTSPLNAIVFRCVYDGLGRLASKTVPSKGATYIVYDQWNRPVLAQDALMRVTNKWDYIKYDAKGRVVSQGIYTDTIHTSQSAMQTYVNGFSTWYESRSSTLTNGGYYTNGAFPTSNTTALGYAYYDDYDMNDDGTDDFWYNAQSDPSLPNEESATTAKLKGVPTMTSVTTVGAGVASNTWLTTVIFYDKRGNPIQVRSNNELYHPGDTVLTDTKTIVPDFAGVPQTAKVVEKSGAGVSVTVYTAFTYDHMYRLTKVSQKYNTGSMQAVAAYTYNEIGQVIKKGLGYKTSTTWLQNVDMRYNIRAQLLSINNSTLASDGNITNGDTNDVFGMQMLYDQVDSGVTNTPYFDGKLSAVKWRNKNASGTKLRERSYKFTYDDLNRYTAETYGERVTAGTGSFSANANGFDEYGITYDEGGNITALKRNSSTLGGSSHTMIDDLTYTYSSTSPYRLKSVADAGTSSGFPGGSGNYVYDANGNLLTDTYKQLAISYNVLNRTDTIKITSVSNRFLTYTYDAGGNLIRKQQFDDSSGTAVLKNTTDYIDGFVYINDTLSYFPMPEGRVLYNAGSFTQEFIITDQQGNARISFQNNGGSAKVYQENSYYGYGMAFLTSPVGLPATPNKRLYNGGSEWQNDYSNMPDYYQTFNRNYDAALGRFVGVDPDAESAESMTSYNYAGDNPIMYNDPLGNYAAPVARYNGQVVDFGSAIFTLADWNQAWANFWGDAGVDPGADFYTGGGGSGGEGGGGGDLVAGDPGTSGANTAAHSVSPSSGETSLFNYPDGRSTEILDGSNAVYKVLPDGSIVFVGWSDQGGANVEDDQTVKDFKAGMYIGIYGIVPGTAVDIKSTKTNANQGGTPAGSGYDLDPSTVGHNYFSSVYIGPDNPMSYNRLKYYYNVAPKDRADAGARQHDLGYDAVHATGVSGVFFDTSALPADYNLIGYEFGLGANPYNGATTTERKEGFMISIGIGLAIIPKLFMEGLSSIKN